MRAHRSALAILALGLTMVVVVAACGSSGSSTARTAGTAGTTTASSPVYKDVLTADGTPKVGGSIVYGVEGESDGWNPTSSG